MSEILNPNTIQQAELKLSPSASGALNEVNNELNQDPPVSG